MLVRTYKKNSVINHDQQLTLLDSLKQFAILNSARIREEHRESIFGVPSKLFSILHDDPNMTLSMAEIGEITGKDASTISRNLKKAKKEN